jgi:hypothetical protein
MAGEPDDLVLQLLRKFDERTLRMSDDIHDFKIGMTSVEENMAVLNRRVDRIETRLDRVEVRLGLVEV